MSQKRIIVDEKCSESNICREEPPRSMREAEADRAKEFLDDFLTPISSADYESYEDFNYVSMEKWGDRNREKAKGYLQTLYNMAIGRR